MSSAKEKEMELDESFDAVVCRPLGRIMAKAFARTSLTANQVSGLAALCGMLAGALYALPWPYPAFGVVAMFMMMVLDCADGELARLRGGGTWRGRILDGLCDFVTAFSIHLGMLIHIIRAGGASLYGYELGPFELFCIGLAAGAAMAWRCGVVDDIKQRLKTRSIDNELAEYQGDADGLWDRFLYWALQQYVKGIRRYSGKRRPGGYTCFRRAQVVGPTHHHLAMMIAGLLAQYTPYAFFAFYLISLIPANAYLLMVLWLAPKTLGAEDAAVTEAA
jgi:hypothetical protein